MAMTSPQGLSPAWYAALTLLSLYGYWWATEFFEVFFEPAVFLPFLVAWLACRYSSSLTTLWLWAGVLAASGITYNLAGRLSIGLGYAALFVLLAVVATYTISRPIPSDSLSGLFNQRWTWLRWLVPVALWPAIYLGQWPVFEFGDNFELGFKPGLAILALVLLPGMNISALASKLDTHIHGSKHPWVNRMRVALLVALALLVVVDLRWQVTDALQLEFGFAGRMQLLLIGVTLLAALRIVDWRLLIVGLLAFLSLEWPLFWIADSIESLLESLKQAEVDTSAQGTPAADAIKQIVVSASRISRHVWFPEGAIYGISAILMATAFAPFVESRKSEALFERRTVVFVLAALVVVLIGGPLFLYGVNSFGMFLLGTAAYLCGLKWKLRGLLLSPFVLQLAYLSLLPLMITDEYELRERVLDVVDIGFYSFVFAYFGFLSNRLPAGPRKEGSTPAVPGRLT